MLRSRLTRTLLVAGVGAALQYFLDANRGRARRVRTKDQALAFARRNQDRLSDKREYLEDRAHGLAHEVAHPHGEAPDNYQTLVDKIRSEVLGGAKYTERTINVDAAHGVVSLRGELKHPEDIRELREAVAKIPGVREVQSYLHLPGTPAPNKPEAERARPT